MPTPPKVVHLDGLDAVPGPGSLTWRPVRLALGIRAFGCNAYTAAEAGQDVVEPHSEDPKLAHEELYFVATGRAVFTIDGESHDAPCRHVRVRPRSGLGAPRRRCRAGHHGPQLRRPTDVRALRLGMGVPGHTADPQRSRHARGRFSRRGSASIRRREASTTTWPASRLSTAAAMGRCRRCGPRSSAVAQAAEWARDDEDFESLREDPEFRALAGL